MSWKVILIAILDVLLPIVAGVGTWFLTSLDQTAGRDGMNYVVRTLRAISVALLTVILLFILEAPLNYFDVPLLVFAVIGFGYIFRSVISEIFAGGLIKLIDPASGQPDRPIDAVVARQHEKEISRLIRSGQRAEAIQLCERLKETGEVERMTLEHTLEYLGVKQSAPDRTPPLVVAARLREQGNVAEAEKMLVALLRKNPADEGAGIMLMRVYAQDLRQPERAEAVWRTLAQQRGVSADHLEFARRSLDEWCQSAQAGAGGQPGAGPAPLPARNPLEPPPLPPVPPTIEELLAQGGLGMAVEMLEEQIKARPNDVALHLQLAEVHALHCKNLRQAERIIYHLQFVPGVTAEQYNQARAKLGAWRTAPKQA
jgi:hypothetical protein